MVLDEVCYHGLEVTTGGVGVVHRGLGGVSAVACVCVGGWRVCVCACGGGGAILYELKAHSYCNSTTHSTVLYFFCILPINSTAILLFLLTFSLYCNCTTHLTYCDYTDCIMLTRSNHIYCVGVAEHVCVQMVAYRLLRMQIVVATMRGEVSCCFET